MKSPCIPAERSIGLQAAMTENKALFFVDDGYSGTSFELPSWCELVEKIENGEVYTLIVKDMSRLGRDYLKVGFSTEVLFVKRVCGLSLSITA